MLTSGFQRAPSGIGCRSGCTTYTRPIEADHVLGDLLERGNGTADAHPTLRLAYAHLKAYETRRAREIASAKRL